MIRLTREGCFALGAHATGLTIAVIEGRWLAAAIFVCGAGCALLFNRESVSA